MRMTGTEERVDSLPRWLVGLGIVMATAYGGFVLVLWRLGLFDVPDAGADARIFAAVFALLGGLVGALLTFVAALLKHSVDTRTLELSHQTEARLRLDSSLRAVELLSTSDGIKSPPAKQAGSLFSHLLCWLRSGRLEISTA
jgi:hypothetical protein